MTSQEPLLTHLPIEEIGIEPGFNPRKFFDNTEFRELIASVRSQGVLQPIIVRPRPDNEGYWVVAGERRFRASLEAKLTDIPSVVRTLSDDEAKLVALLENTQRADMSPAEEAEAARDVLTHCHNDRQEAIRQLGWSQTKFDARLLLLHADKDVLLALTERKIKLGHAELLSQLPTDFQSATLPKIIEHGYPVAELKDRLATFAQDLSVACFNTDECQRCHHNSTVQASVFDEHIGRGNCANRDCFGQKTQAALQEKKASLSEQYPVIFLDTERKPDSYKMVCQTGSEGVGRQQFETGCHQCAHFGALMSTSPNHLGRVTDDCCFNLTCHAEKIAAHQKSVKESAQTADKHSGVGKVKGAKSTQSDNGRVTAPDKSAPNPAAMPARVTEKVEAFYRELAAKKATDNKLAVWATNTFALYRLVQNSFSKERMPKPFQDIGYGLTFEQFLTICTALGLEETKRFNATLLSHLLGEHEKSQPHSNKEWAKGAAAVVSITDTFLAEHFILDREFLGTFTKSGIEGILTEAVNKDDEAFTDFYGRLGTDKSLAGLMKKKHGEILDDVFGCGYDFTGFVPACIQSFVCKNPNNITNED